MNKRIRHIDICKGVGIIFVLWGHSLIEVGHYIIYMFHMPLFFFLSGMVFRPKADQKEYMKKKSRKLLLPMLLFGVIAFIIGRFYNDYCPLHMTPPHLGAELGPLWFLWVLFLCSLTYNFLLNHVSSCWALVVSSAFCYLLGYLPDAYGLRNYIYIYSYGSLLIFFVLGHCCRERLKKLSTGSAWILFVAGAVILIVLYLLQFKVFRLGTSDLYDNLHPKNFLLWIGGALSGIAMTLGLSLLIDRYGRAAAFFAWLGVCSLCVFALHMPVFDFIHHYMPADWSSVCFEIGLILLSAIGLAFTKPVFDRVLKRL